MATNVTEQPEIFESVIADECPPCKTGAAMWMTTFSDMATLLMALFAILIAFAEMQKAESMLAIEGEGRLDRGVQSEIESYEAPSQTNITHLDQGMQIQMRGLLWSSRPWQKKLKTAQYRSSFKMNALS